VLPRGNTPGVQLGARDQEILRDVVRFVALTVEQIARRHFGAKITAYKRLERIADGGYLRLVRWWLRGPGVYLALRQLRLVVWCKSEVADSPGGE
jgi:hypothetical protein